MSKCLTFLSEKLAWRVSISLETGTPNSPSWFFSREWVGRRVEGIWFHKVLHHAEHQSELSWFSGPDFSTGLQSSPHRTGRNRSTQRATLPTKAEQRSRAQELQPPFAASQTGVHRKPDTATAS